MRDKFLSWAKNSSEDLKERICGIGADDNWKFERDYFILASQYQLLQAIIEMIKNGDFDD